MRGSLYKAIESETISLGFEPRRGVLFSFNLLFLFNFLFFEFNLRIYFFFLINLKGSVTDFCHALPEPRSLHYGLIHFFFFYCFSPFIVSGRACMTISPSTLALARSAKNINGRQLCILHVKSER